LVTKMSRAASEDITRTLTELAETTGEAKYVDALSAFAAHDKLWRDQSAMAKKVLGKVLGKSPGDILETGPEIWGADLNPEAAVEAIKNFAAEDHRSLIALSSTLDPSTQVSVRASLINGLGRTAGDEFDPKLFVRNLNEIPERTARVVFGKEGYDALQDLKSVAGLFNDRVGKGAQVPYWAKRFEAALLLAGAGVVGSVGGLTGAAGSMGAAGALLGLQRLRGNNLAKMLARPDLARQFAKVARAETPKDRQSALTQLARYAGRVPEFREPIENMVKELMGDPVVTGKPLLVEDKPPESVEEVAPSIDLSAYKTKMGAAEGTGKNPESSAVGPYQFTDPTFLRVYKATFPDGEGMSDEEIFAQRGSGVEEAMIDTFNQENLTKLAGAGIPPTMGTLYLTHFLGPEGGLRVLQAEPNTPITEVTSAEARSSNEKVFKNLRTASDLIDWADSKMAS